MIDTKRKAEIVSVRSFKEENEILIALDGNEAQVQDEVVSSENNVSDHQNIQDLYEIKFDDLLGKKYQGSNLIEEVNKWANLKGFHLIYCEGEQKLKKTLKRTLKCREKACNYKILFKSDENEKNFQIYQKLSVRYTKHSKIIFFFLIL